MKAHFKQNWLWYTLILLLIGGNMYSYIGERLARREADQAMVVAETAFETKLIESKQELLGDRIEEDARFYVSLLSELIYSRRWSQAKTQMKHIVRHSRVTAIDYLQPDGDITVSTLPREGQSGKSIFSETLLADHVKLVTEDVSDGQLMAVPLNHNGMDLGHVIIHYSSHDMNMVPIQ